MSAETEEAATELVAASMGYVLAKLSEDRDWLHRLSRMSTNLEHALRPDAEVFMKHRGRFMLADLLAVRPIPADSGKES